MASGAEHQSTGSHCVPPMTFPHGWSVDQQEKSTGTCGAPSQKQKVEPVLRMHSKHFQVVVQYYASLTLTSINSFHSKEEELWTSSLKTTTLFIITVVFVMAMLVWLRAVMVPFVLAVFFMLVMEPLFLALVRPVEMVTFDNNRHHCVSSAATFLGGVWIAISVVSCLLIIIITFGASVFFIIRSVQSFSWIKYKNSPKLQNLIVYFEEAEAVAAQHDSSLVEALAEGPLMGVVDLVLSVFSTLFMAGLFLAFLLLSRVGSDRASWFGLQTEAKKRVQKYLQIKSALSLIVGGAIWFILSRFEVDLAFLWSFITVLLNFIPHIGYTVALLVPLPMIFLDPEKNWSDLINCIIWPLLVHQIMANVVEPRLMGITFDMHPINVLVGLAFWTLCWGAAGAVLSTPLLCLLQLLASRFDHPIAHFVGSALVLDRAPKVHKKDI